MTFSEDFEEAVFGHVQDGSFSLGRNTLILGKEGHQLEDGRENMD